MKKTFFASLLLVLIGYQGIGQNSKKEQDVKAIKDMCGCYKVNFKYTETFAPEIDYEKHLDYTSGALEWAELIEDSENKLSIQHLLLVGKNRVIKHWRQDWEYENQRVFHYDKNNKWVFKNLTKDAVKGQWTQKVYQVDDSPRYSGSSTWIHADGKHYWENKSDSPLPRREYSKRKDYNVMSRGNRHEITKNGWLHEQDNDKIIRKNGKEDVLLTQEKGYNTYVKVPDSECKSAIDWWTKNNKFWTKVRRSWDKVYDNESSLTLRKTMNEKPLHKHFYDLEKNDASKKDITTLIKKFSINNNNTANASGK